MSTACIQSASLLKSAKYHSKLYNILKAHTFSCIYFISQTISNSDINRLLQETVWNSQPGWSVFIKYFLICFYIYTTKKHFFICKPILYTKKYLIELKNNRLWQNSGELFSWLNLISFLYFYQKVYNVTRSRTIVNNSFRFLKIPIAAAQMNSSLPGTSVCNWLDFLFLRRRHLLKKSGGRRNHTRLST